VQAAMIERDEFSIPMLHPCRTLLEVGEQAREHLRAIGVVELGALVAPQKHRPPFGRAVGGGDVLDDDVAVEVGLNGHGHMGCEKIARMCVCCSLNCW